jgi:hypothetical protein
MEEIIEELNPLIRGWNNYQTRIQAEAKRFETLNRFVYDRLRIFLKRKYSSQIAAPNYWQIHFAKQIQLIQISSFSDSIRYIFSVIDSGSELVYSSSDSTI